MDVFEFIHAPKPVSASGAIMRSLSLVDIPLYLLLMTPTSAWTITTSAISAAASRTRTRTTQRHMNTVQIPTTLSHHSPRKTAINGVGAETSVEHADIHSHNPPGSLLTRASWLRTGASLASIASLVFALGSRVEAATGGGSVTVIGAGGKTGKECVEYLVARGTAATAVARSLTNSEGEPLKFTANDKVKLTTADVTVPSSLPEVVKGSSAVIFASSASKQGGSAKAVDYEGVVNVARACLEMKVPRLVVVSSGGVASPNSSVYKFLNLFGEIMSWKIRGEDELRSMYAAQGSSATCHYTIVRPGGLTLDPPRGVTAIELNQGDTKSGRIARADVARVCVESIYSPAAEDCTLECYYKDTAKPLDTVGLSNMLRQTVKPEGAQVMGTERRGDTWEALFTGLKRDA